MAKRKSTPFGPSGSGIESIKLHDPRPQKGVFISKRGAAVLLGAGASIIAAAKFFEGDDDDPPSTGANHFESSDGAPKELNFDEFVAVAPYVVLVVALGYMWLRSRQVHQPA